MAEPWPAHSSVYQFLSSVIGGCLGRFRGAILTAAHAAGYLILANRYLILRSMIGWSIQKARDTYNIAHWSGGYFDINGKGHLVCRPDARIEHPGIDMFELSREIKAVGLSLPVLVRFSDILPPRRDPVRRLRPRDAGRRLPRPLHLGLPDQGQPAEKRGRENPRARRRPRRARGRLQARAAGGAGAVGA